MQPSPLANPLATAIELETSGSQLDGIPRDLEDSMRFGGARLTQAAGTLLRIPQETIAQAIIILMRFFVSPEGGSLAEFGVEQVSSASLYLAAKLSAFPKSVRNVLNVYAYIACLSTTYPDLDELWQKPSEAKYYVSEGAYERQRTALFVTEQRILKTLGFNLQAQLPYTLCITYLQTLEVFTHPRARELVKRAIAHLNSALLSPQLLYLTHQPTALATAAIYLAAREVSIKMPEVEWWEVFDTDREELGFLCAGMLSLEGFAQREKDIWAGRKVPMTVEETEKVLKARAKDVEG